MTAPGALRDRPVKGTDLRLTELAFGGASIGNLYTAVSDASAIAAVEQAWESGIRYFDTAPHYGLGLSERRLGAALARYDRADLVISTKVGRLLVANESPTDHDDGGFMVPGAMSRRWDFSRDGVFRSVEESLERLDMSRIDILYLHDPDQSPFDDAIRTGAAALAELRDQGVVRAIGIGSNSASAVARAFRETDIDLAMLAGRYTLLEPRGADDVFAAADGRSLVAAGIFNSGLLATPRPSAGSMYGYLPVSPTVLTRAQHLADVAESVGWTLPQAALAFPLRNPAVASVAVGMRSRAQVSANVELLNSSPSPARWEAFERSGLLATG